MTPDRISTTGQIVLKTETFDTNSSSGNGTTRVYTGSKALIFAQKQVELGFGATMTKVESTGDGNYQLTAGYTWDTSQGGNSAPPVNSHCLEVEMEQIDVYSSDELRSQLYTLFGSWDGVTGAITFIKGKVDQFQTAITNLGKDATGSQITALKDSCEALFSIYSSGAQRNFMLNLFRGIAMHGQINATQFNTIYQRRIVAASYNQVQAGFTGVKKVWTTNEILSFENVPATWWFQLPAAYLWKKTPPIVQTVAGQKTEITYSYIGCIAAWGATHEAYGTAVLLSF
ncbi:MAG: hypothetical protein WDN00_18105 [Limisphaerales bacterium]